MDTQINLDDIERKALAATPGPWNRQDFYSSGSRLGVDGPDGQVICASFGAGRPGDFDFIAAANPSVVIELVRRLRAAEAQSVEAPKSGEQTIRTDVIAVQWWLAELDQHGNPTLVDGAHSDRSGADQAMYLFHALNLGAGQRYAVARVELSEPKPSGEGLNHEAIQALNGAQQNVSLKSEG